MGAPGVPAAGVLVSEVQIPFAVAGLHIKTEATLTPLAVPVPPDQIYNAERMYELRLALDAGLPGDILLAIWGGILVGITL